LHNHLVPAKMISRLAALNREEKTQVIWLVTSRIFFQVVLFHSVCFINQCHTYLCADLWHLQVEV